LPSGETVKPCLPLGQPAGATLGRSRVERDRGWAPSGLEVIETPRPTASCRRTARSGVPSSREQQAGRAPKPHEEERPAVGRLVGDGAAPLGDALLGASRSGDPPDVRGAALPAGGEVDEAAVAREARLVLVARAVGQPARGAAVGPDRPDVPVPVLALRVKGDRAAVRRPLATPLRPGPCVSRNGLSRRRRPADLVRVARRSDSNATRRPSGENWGP
jgi:hypothetical protein